MSGTFRAHSESRGWAPIIRTLRAHGQPMTRRQLSDAMGKSKTYTQHYLPAMVAAGVVCVGSGTRTFGRAPQAYGLREWSL